MLLLLAAAVIPYAVQATPSDSSTAAAQARATSSSDSGPILVEGVEVTARRGATEFTPQHEIGEAEIDALLATNIGDVITQVNERYGGQAAPVVIVNGQRIADADAFKSFPPDALVRVEVLPSGASEIYADGDPTRKVVNIVLQKRFASYDGVLNRSTPTAGETATLSGGLRRGRINDLNTSQSGVRASDTSSLRANERPDYLESHPDSTGATLRSQSRSASADYSLTRSLGPWRGSIRSAVQAHESHFTSGTEEEQVASRNRSRIFDVTTGLSREAWGWSVQMQAFGRIAHSDINGATTSSSDNRSVNLSLNANRKLLALPTGAVRATVSARAARSWSETERESVARRSSGSETLDVRLTVPLLRITKGEEIGRNSHVGAVSSRLSLGQRISDTGRGSNIGGNLSWAPLARLSFDGAWSRSSDAPSDEKLYAPMAYGNPITVYDFRTGQSVEVLPLTGGNPDLRAPKLDGVTLGVSSGPFTAWRLITNASYQRSETIDGIGSMPATTAEVEAAFPSRFQRDADGKLVSIDQRPINIDSAVSSSVSANFNLSLPVADPMTGSVQVWASQTWTLSDFVTIRAGLPRMNRMAGDGGGSAPRTLRGGFNARRKPWSLSVNANWNEGYRIRASSGRNDASDLVIGDFATINLKLGYQLARVTPQPARPTDDAVARRRNRGLSLDFEVENLLDARPQARLGDGKAASGYGRNDRDHIGRRVKIGLSTRF